MSKIKKAGRPKMPENKRKIRFSVTLKPELIKRIDKRKTPGIGRNAVIEETLEKNI
jgi:hypothetical protein